MSACARFAPWFRDPPQLPPYRPVGDVIWCIGGGCEVRNLLDETWYTIIPLWHKSQPLQGSLR